MPLRAPKMYCFIFGFQRLVWCPKWTPASRSCFMLISVMYLATSYDGSVVNRPFVAGRLARVQTARGGQLETSGVHRFQEFFVGLGALHLVDEKFHGLDRVKLRQELAQDPDPVERAAREQQLFLAGGRALNVDGREDA